MGTFTHLITLYSASGEASETLEALVDTGSSFTTMPAPILERLGIARFATIRLRLATGQVVERDIGEAVVELNGLPRRTVICVFGDRDAPPSIGAQTLETFLLGVDPDQKQLVPLEGWWARHAQLPSHL